MANGHGGARPGAGRPKKSEKYGGQIAAAEDRIADQLPQLADLMLKLAKGGYWEVEEEWQPSAIVTVGSGEFEQPAFPDKDPTELVLVKRKRSKAAPDRSAITDALNRILGRPTQRVELTGEEGGPIAVDDLRGLSSDELRQLAASSSGGTGTP